MLVELLSQSNYQSFNIKLAHLLGLETSIYLSALIDINEKAIRKDKVIEGDFFSIDRDYITKRTTLSNNKQEKIETELNKTGLIELSNEYIKLCLDTLTSLVMSEDENLEKDLSNFKKAVNSKSKSDFILESVKRNIDSSLPYELIKAYSDWLDAVYAKFGFVSKQTLFSAQKEVDEAANHNLDKAIEIINIATARGWRDLKWAVKVYSEQHPCNNKVIENKNVQIDRSKSF